MELLRLPPTVTVDHCPQCHGLWLDHGELKRLVRTRITERADPRTLLDAERTGLLCPDCKRPLFERAFMPGSDVLIIQCSDCAGIFLEAGRLARVKNFLASLQAKKRPQ